MAYKKRFKKTARRRTKKAQYTVGGSVAHLAKRAMQGVKFLKEMINVEYKYFDVATLPTQFDYTGAVTTLFAPSQGFAAQDRNGDSVKLTSVDIGISLYKGSAQNAVIPYRIMLIQGSNEDGVPPTGVEILQAPGSYQAVNCPRNVDFTKQYKIIWETRGKIVPSTNDPNAVQHIEVYKELDHHISFQAGTTTIMDGGLYLMFVNDTQLGTNNVPDYRFYCRTRFVDN